MKSDRAKKREKIECAKRYDDDEVKKTLRLDFFLSLLQALMISRSSLVQY